MTLSQPKTDKQKMGMVGVKHKQSQLTYWLASTLNSL